MTLEALRVALLVETQADLRERLAEVDAECARVVAAAQSKARELAGQARAEGESAAAKEAVRRGGVATRRAREIRLQAQRRQLDALRRMSRNAVLNLREDSRYLGLVERLTEAARDQLGPECEIEIDPDGRGGVIGRKGKMSVDYTLSALVDREIESLGDEREGLWR